MVEHAPFFIFGCPRSGTSLLSRMLNSHHRLGVPYESHIFNNFYPWLKYYGNLATVDGRARLIDDILATDVMQDWRPRLTREQVLPLVEESSFGDIFDATMRAWIAMTGKERWGEKTPHHLFYWPQISKFFPQAKIIHLVRDGRDVALSYVSARFGPTTVYGAAQSWCRYLAEVDRLKKTFKPGLVCEIRYEDLVSEPEITLKQLCAFIGEEYDPNMMQFYTNPAQYPTDKRNMHNLRRSVMKGNVGKWKLGMPRTELEIFESLTRDDLLRFGYQPATDCPGVSTSRKIYYGMLKGPLSKSFAMLKNKKGHRDALILSRIRLKLLLAGQRQSMPGLIMLALSSA